MNKEFGKKNIYGRYILSLMLLVFIFAVVISSLVMFCYVFYRETQGYIIVFYENNQTIATFEFIVCCISIILLVAWFIVTCRFLKETLNSRLNYYDR